MKFFLQALLVSLLWLTACAQPAQMLSTETPTPLPTEAVTRAPLATPRLVTPTPHAPAAGTPVRVATASETGIAPAQCAYIFASQPLPELSDALLISLQASGLNVVSLGASAYGENCLDASGAVVSFAAMQTDYKIALQVNDLQDETSLGQAIYLILLNLEARWPVGSTPGSNPGQIALTLTTSNGEELRLNLARADLVRHAISENLSAAELFRMMNGE